MDTNLVAALIEAMRTVPAPQAGISTGWKDIADVIQTLGLAWIAWKSHATGVSTKENSEATKRIDETSKRIEKDVNSTALALAEEKKKTQETVLLLSQQKAAQDEKIRGMENVKAAASLPPGAVFPAASPLFSEEQLAQIVKALKG